MTTAHRPTWHNALGGENQGGNRLIPTQKVSSRDQPGNLTLKQRKPEQGPQTTNKKKLEQQLQAKEKQAAAARRKLASTLSALPAEHYVNPFPEDADDGDYRPAAALLGGSSSSQQQRGSSKDARGGGGGAAGEKLGDTAGGSSSEDLSDEESDEEQELLRELEKIKQERREEERAKRAAEEKKKEAEQKERMLRANPLLLDPELTGGGEHAGAVKRRWDDEVVFKNQAKNLPKAKKQFINDPVRSEFHKKFLSKYIV